MEFVKKNIKFISALLVAVFIYTRATPLLSAFFSYIFDSLWNQPSYFQDPLRTHVTNREMFSKFFSIISSLSVAVISALGMKWLIARYQKEEAAQKKNIKSKATPLSASSSSYPIVLLPSPQPPPSSLPDPVLAQPQPIIKKSGSGIMRQSGQNTARSSQPSPGVTDSATTASMPRSPSSVNFSPSPTPPPSPGPGPVSVAVSLLTRSRRGSDPGNAPYGQGSPQQGREQRATSMGGRADSPSRPPLPILLQASSLRNHPSQLRESTDMSPLSPRSASPLPGSSPRGQSMYAAPGAGGDEKEKITPRQ